MSTDADAAIRRRIDRVDMALDRAIADMKSAVARICRLQARRSRLAAALALGAQERQARARKALETRRQVPAHRQRGIRLTEGDE